MENIKIIKLKSVDSTNDFLKQSALLGERENTVVIAETQTAGKGTKNRSFISDKGGLYISILLRPKFKGFDATLITPMTAVAVSETIDALSSQKSGIKWVNDVYIGQKKVCGILCESVIDNNGELPFIIVGIGVNLSEPKDGFHKSIADIATSVFEKCDNDLKEQFLNRLLAEFFYYYEHLEEKSFLPLYRQKNIVLSREITVCEFDETYIANADEIDDNCRLIISLKDGTQKTLFSGDVSLKL